MPTDALITQSIPSLINGVSQQPTVQRLTSQCEEQINVISDVADGIVVRPPAEHVAIIDALGVPTGGLQVHMINRGDSQRFAAIVELGDINVIDLTDGSAVVVNDNAAGIEGSYDYLAFDTATDTAKTAVELVTVADYTFVLNKKITAQMVSPSSDDREHVHEFILFIKGGGSTAANSTVNLKIDGTNFTGLPADIGNSSDAMGVLCTALTGGASPSDTVGGVGATNWRFTRIGDNVLHGYQALNLGSLEAISASDGFGDTIHVLATTGTDGSPPSVAKFSDLPSTGYPDFAVKIKGDEGSNEDEFWVAYSDENGIWEETVAPDIDNSIDGATMPHALIYDNATGEFSFEPLTWATRGAGDTNSAPEPSFIGKTINDIVVHKNRLTLISEENAIAGESGEFFNFWPNTVSTLLDSDPFDIAGTGNTVAIWDYAVPYRGDLSLFSATGDVIGELTGSQDEPLTIKNARIEDRANYAMTPIRPVAAGEQVYFLADHSGHTVMQAYIEADVGLFRADEVTAHVATYVPPNITQMAASPAENMICLVSSESDEDHRVYVYRYHFVGNEQVMSAWSYWQFADDDVITAIGWIESVAYLFIERSDGIHLVKIDFGVDDEDTERATAANLGYRVHLDDLVYLTGVYDIGTDTTSWALPYAQATNGGTYEIVKGGAWGDERGSLIAVSDASVDGTISATGDFSANPAYIGRKFTWTYELTEIHVRDAVGSVQRGRLANRLQLRSGQVAFRDTGTFNVEIRSRADSDVYTDTFTSQFLNQAVFGPTQLASGTFDFGIGGASKDVRIIFTGDSFLPARLASLEWTGRFVQRSDQS